jgi:hypothetical protein
MDHPLYFLKRHAMRAAMTFVFFVPAVSVCPVLSSAGESIEELVDKGEITGNVDKLFEDLEELKQKPLRINSADPDELRLLPWLGSSDIYELVSRRKKRTIDSIDQLAEIIGRQKAESIAPYISFAAEPDVREAKSLDEFSGSLYSRVLWETPPRKGIVSGNYAGDNYKTYNRLQLAFSNWKLSIVDEKDIGEPEFSDFISMSVSATDLGIVKNLVVGNYELNFGEGLIIGQGRYYTSGSDLSGSIRISSKRLSAYASSSEYGFFQGAAAAIELKPFALTAFCSANLVDAIINKTSGIITSFDESGYHRTLTERNRKDNVTEKVYGCNLLYNLESSSINGKIGGTWLHYDYGTALKFLGGIDSSASLGGVEADLSIGKLGIFGEAAWNDKPGSDRSWEIGADYEVMHGVKTLVALRDYGTGYYSPFASAFAERGDHADNEKGVYAGLNVRLAENLSIGGYYDWFSFPVLDDHCQFSSAGHDSRIFLTWKPSRKVAWDLQVQHKYKEEQKNQGTTKYPLWTALPKITDRCRLDCDIDISRYLHLRAFGEIKRAVRKYLAGDQEFYGKLIYAQAAFKRGIMDMKARFTVFNVEDYDAAVYVYEDDLPLSFNMGMYNGRGRALILLAALKPWKKLTLAARFEKVWYSDRDTYGDGNDLRLTSSPASFHLGAMMKF